MATDTTQWEAAEPCSAVMSISLSPAVDPLLTVTKRCLQHQRDGKRKPECGTAEQLPKQQADVGGLHMKQHWPKPGFSMLPTLQ